MQSRGYQASNGGDRNQYELSHHRRCRAPSKSDDRGFDPVGRFYFQLTTIHSLSVDEAVELITRISLEHSNRELIRYLKSAEGQFRIRASHYLAGVNHRMYVLLSEFLTKESLDDLVAAFDSLANDMTPFFQERIRALPDQQRQLVQCLCDAPCACASEAR